MGGTVAGRASSADYPPEAQSAPELGSSYRPNIEGILAAQPDLLVADSIIQPQLRDQLEGLGMPVLFVGAQTFADVPRALRLVGQAVGRAAAGETAASALEAKLAGLQAKLPAQRPKVLILNGTPQDFFVAKPESYVGDLVKQLGATNVAEGQPDVGRFAGYTKMTLEAVVATDPDVILVITAAGADAPKISEQLAADPAWSGLEAVRAGKVHEINLQLFLQAPGPRAGEAIDLLMGLLYPGRS